MPNSSTATLTSNGGLTTAELTRRLESDPTQAAQLGAYFRSSQTVNYENRSLGSYQVSGAEDGLLYDRQGTSDVLSQKNSGPTMTPDTEYRLRADGDIDKNGYWPGGHVGPGEITDTGQTRLQVVIEKNGETLRQLNYLPDANGEMRVATRAGEEGSTMRFMFLDGDMSDNDGQFNVKVDETRRTVKTTNVAIAADDAEGIVDAGRVVAEQLETAPQAASIPEPDPTLANAPAGRGLILDKDHNEVSTPDGYTFKFNENEVSIYGPDRGDPIMFVDGRNVTEGDRAGTPTQYKIEDGNLIAPNGAMVHLEYDGDNIRRAEVINGDSRVRVNGPGLDGELVSLSDVEGGGIARREEIMAGDPPATNYRIGGFNDASDDLDVTVNLEKGSYDLGRIERGHDEQSGDVRVDSQPYFVDPELRPAFGTEQYERMLRSEIDDQRQLLAADFRADGRDPAMADAMAEYILGPGTGRYDQVADEMAASRYQRTGELPEGYDQRQDPRVADQQGWREQFTDRQQAIAEQLLGGLPAHFRNYPEVQQAVMQLAAAMASQGSLQNDYQAGAQNLRSYIPSVEQARQNADMPSDLLVEQALAGQRSRGNGERFDLSQDPRFSQDPSMRRFQGGDPNSQLIRQRMQDGQSYEGGNTTGGNATARSIANDAMGWHYGAAAGRARAAAIRAGTASSGAQVLRNGAQNVRNAASSIRNAPGRMAEAVRSRFRPRPGAPLRAGANVIDMVQNPRTGVWEVPKTPKTSALALRGAQGETRALASETRALARSGEIAAGARGGSKALQALRAVGKPLIVVGLVADAIDIGSSYNQDVARGDGNFKETKKAVGRSAGGWAGAIGGAQLGATIGAIGGPIGAVVGGVVGGIVGAIGGSKVGEWLGSLF